MSSNPEKSVLKIPDEILKTSWDSSIICTYGCDLEFYEQHLFKPGLNRAKNNIVLADHKKVDAIVNDDRRFHKLASANSEYVVAPLYSGHAAHAKLIMLLKKDRGVLLVGSGNLGLKGYAREGECFTRYCFEVENGGSRAPFIEARLFLEGLAAKNLMDERAASFLEMIWEDTGWIPNEDVDNSCVVSNLDNPIAHSFNEKISETFEGKSVDELTIQSPFFDRKCKALERLISTTNPGLVKLYLQQGETLIAPKALEALIQRSGSKLEIYSAIKNDAYLHAKILIVRSGNKAVCLQGSANLSAPALNATVENGNIELCNIQSGPYSSFEHLINELDEASFKVNSLKDLDLDFETDDADSENVREPSPFRNIAWEAPFLTGTYRGELHKTLILKVKGHLIPDSDIDWNIVALGDSQNSFKAELHERWLENFEQQGPFRFSFSFEKEPDEEYSCLPYFETELGNRTFFDSSERKEIIAREFLELPESISDLLCALKLLEEEGDRVSQWGSKQRASSKRARKQSEFDSDGDEDNEDDDSLFSEPSPYEEPVIYDLEDPFNSSINNSGLFRAWKAGDDSSRSGEGSGGSNPGGGSGSPKPGAPPAKPSKNGPASKTRANRAYLRRSLETAQKEFKPGEHKNMVKAYLICNSLCYELMAKGEFHPADVFDTQLTLWEHFWGQGGNFRQTEQLRDDSKFEILEMLDLAKDQCTVLASCMLYIDKAKVELLHEHELELRDVLRSAIVDDLFSFGPKTLREVVKIGNNNRVFVAVNSVREFLNQDIDMRVLESEVKNAENLASVTKKYEALVEKGIRNRRAEIKAIRKKREFGDTDDLDEDQELHDLQVALNSLKVGGSNEESLYKRIRTFLLEYHFEDYVKAREAALGAGAKMQTIRDEFRDFQEDLNPTIIVKKAQCTKGNFKNILNWMVSMVQERSRNDIRIEILISDSDSANEALVHFSEEYGEYVFRLDKYSSEPEVLVLEAEADSDWVSQFERMNPAFVN